MFNKPTLRVEKIANIPARDTLPGLPALVLEAPEFVTETDSKPWWAFSEEFGQRLHIVEDPEGQQQFEAIEGDVSREHFEQQPTTRYRAIKADPTPRLPPCQYAPVLEKSSWLRRYWGVCAVSVVLAWGVILYCIASLGLSVPRR